jgi:hypothetical protein
VSGLSIQHFTARGEDLVHLVSSGSSGLSGLSGFSGFAQQEKQDKPANPLALLPSAIGHQPYALLFMPSPHTLSYYSLRRSMHDEGMD